MSNNRYVKVKLTSSTVNGDLGLGEFELDKENDVLSVGKGNFPTGDIVTMSNSDEREVNK
nr:MAG TPA_asm: hypothetical protein [Caudoviricetes sp.]